MTHLEQALRLAELGWQVFALGPTGFPFPNCRTCSETCVTADDYDSCDHLICHGCYAGTNEVDRLTAMWEHLPHALIGVRTGRASGLFVLDFDKHSADKDGKTSANSLRGRGLLTRGAAAYTGGGGGHLYCQHPMNLDVPNNNTGRLGLGVDVKGEGGYVLAPPSAKRGKPSYWWAPGLDPWSVPLAVLPMEALDLITKSDTKPIQLDSSKITHSSDEQILVRWENALTDLRESTVGSRNAALYYAACRGGETIASGQIKNHQSVIDSLEDAASQAGLRISEIRQTIRSGLNRGAKSFLEEAE